jgi:hypothetical protein
MIHPRLIASWRKNWSRWQALRIPALPASVIKFDGGVGFAPREVHRPTVEYHGVGPNFTSEIPRRTRGIGLVAGLPGSRRNVQQREPSAAVSVGRQRYLLHLVTGRTARAPGAPVPITALGHRRGGSDRSVNRFPMLPRSPSGAVPQISPSPSKHVVGDMGVDVRRRMPAPLPLITAGSRRVETSLSAALDPRPRGNDAQSQHSPPQPPKSAFRSVAPISPLNIVGPPASASVAENAKIAKTATSNPSGGSTDEPQTEVRVDGHVLGDWILQHIAQVLERPPTTASFHPATGP